MTSIYDKQASEIKDNANLSQNINDRNKDQGN